METQILAILLLNYTGGAHRGQRYIVLCSAPTLSGASLRAVWGLLLSVTHPQRSDCFSFFGPSTAAFKLTEEGMVHGVEQVHCKKLHSGSGLSSARSLWFLVSNQKASKEHQHLKD